MKEHIILDKYSLYKSLRFKGKKVFLSIKTAHLEGMIIFSVLKTGELISFGTDAEINIWRINQKEYTLLYNLKGHSEIIGQVLPITKNKIASFSLDGTIRILDRKLNFICVTIYNIKEFTLNRTFITYIPNDKTLLFFCREQSLVKSISLKEKRINKKGNY